jgi:hypothetical protein
MSLDVACDVELERPRALPVGASDNLHGTDSAAVDVPDVVREADEEEQQDQGDSDG